MSGERVPRLLIVVMTAMAAAMLVGCGTDAAPSPSTPPSPAVASTTPPDLVPIVATISGGQVEPPPARVDVPVGNTVRITVTSDEHDELHVHGYDLEAELMPGEPGTIEFVANQTGLFEVEGHHSGLQLFQLVVK
jgi:hypothetical protein